MKFSLFFINFPSVCLEMLSLQIFSKQSNFCLSYSKMTCNGCCRVKIIIGESIRIWVVITYKLKDTRALQHIDTQF